MSWISSLLGMDASHAAGQAQKTADSQTALQNQYGQQAAGVYGQLNQQGNTQSAAYQSNYLPLLQQFGSLAGLGGNTLQGTGTAPGAQRVPTAQGGVNAGQGSNPQAQGGPQDANNPYSLDHNQQGLLNQQLGQLSKSFQQAQGQLAQSFAAKGITDPRAVQVGQEALQEHYNALQEATQTQFYEQIKQDKLKALQELISGVGQYGAQGAQQQEAAGSGYLGLASGAQAAANANQQNALAQTQNAQTQASGALSLLTSFLPRGGIGGSSTPANYIDTSQVGG